MKAAQVVLLLVLGCLQAAVGSNPFANITSKAAAGVAAFAAKASSSGEHSSAGSQPAGQPADTSSYSSYIPKTSNKSPKEKPSSNNTVSKTSKENPNNGYTVSKGPFSHPSVSAKSGVESLQFLQALQASTASPASSGSSIPNGFRLATIPSGLVALSKLSGSVSAAGEASGEATLDAVSEGRGAGAGGNGKANCTDVAAAGGSGGGAEAGGPGSEYAASNKGVFGSIAGKRYACGPNKTVAAQWTSTNSPVGGGEAGAGGGCAAFTPDGLNRAEGGGGGGGYPDPKTNSSSIGYGFISTVNKLLKPGLAAKGSALVELSSVAVTDSSSKLSHLFIDLELSSNVSSVEGTTANTSNAVSGYITSGKVAAVEANATAALGGSYAAYEGKGTAEGPAGFASFECFADLTTSGVTEGCSATQGSNSSTDAATGTMAFTMHTQVVEGQVTATSTAVVKSSFKSSYSALHLTATITTTTVTQLPLLYAGKWPVLSIAVDAAPANHVGGLAGRSNQGTSQDKSSLMAQLDVSIKGSAGSVYEHSLMGILKPGHNLKALIGKPEQKVVKTDKGAGFEKVVASSTSISREVDMTQLMVMIREEVTTTITLALDAST